MIKVSFTREQYRDLLILTYMGQWMAESHEVEENQTYIKLLNHLYAHADKNFDKWIDRTALDGRLFPTREMDDVVQPLIEAYNEENLWDTLSFWQGQRDFYEKYGEEIIEEMSDEIRLTKQGPFITKWEQEFDEHGVDRLEVNEKKVVED